MNEVVFNTLKGKDFVVKNFLIKVATELKLSLNETLLLIYFLNQEEPTLNIQNITNNIYLTEEEIMEAFTRLMGINLISVEVIKMRDGTRSEIISLDNIFKHVTSEITKNHQESQKENLFDVFESEFARPLSPMEFELINDWLIQGIDESLIIAALKEATYNGAKSLRYITKILLAWQEKGYKTKEDINKTQKQESNESLLTDLFEYDWLADGQE
ncbi:MAG: DnaD domain protein [Bacilli bacterium]|nr:DnaD domain protein [Bacilli bacterium]